ncbi:MAG: HAD-IA family hydrolase [Nitrospirae bacterium]|nr:HAD-IA family hydrolase [Nitrospirota bacterium]
MKTYSLKAVFFDVGSTLVNSPGRSPNTLIAGYVNIPGVDSAAVGDIIMQEDFQTPAEVYERLKAAFNGIDPAAKEKIALLWESQPASLERIDAAYDVVKSFKDTGCKTGVISNMWSPYYIAFREACPDLLSLIDYVALSFREGYRKPASEMFLRALDALKLDPQEVLMVGDTYENDIAPAMALGMKTIWVLSRLEHERQALIKVLNGQWARPMCCIDGISALV